jgi:hypothetical protein
MMKVHILDQCEFCDGEVSMRDVPTELAVVSRKNGSACDDHQPQLFRAFVAYHFCCFTCSIDETVDPRRTRGNLLRIV